MIVVVVFVVVIVHVIFVVKRMMKKVHQYYQKIFERLAVASRWLPKAFDGRPRNIV